MYWRIIYHHHSLTRDQNATVFRVYQEQKKYQLKGNWIELLGADFNFIIQELNEP